MANSISVRVARFRHPDFSEISLSTRNHYFHLNFSQSGLPTMVPSPLHSPVHLWSTEVCFGLPFPFLRSPIKYPPVFEDFWRHFGCHIGHLSRDDLSLLDPPLPSWLHSTSFQAPQHLLWRWGRGQSSWFGARRQSGEREGSNGGTSAVFISPISLIFKALQITAIQTPSPPPFTWLLRLEQREWSVLAIPKRGATDVNGVTSTGSNSGGREGGSLPFLLGVGPEFIFSDDFDFIFWFLICRQTLILINRYCVLHFRIFNKLEFLISEIDFTKLKWKMHFPLSKTTRITNVRIIHGTCDPGRIKMVWR